MKIVFLENRYATWVWQRVAQGLIQDGHEIHWFVQNRKFTPTFGRVHHLWPNGKANGKNEERMIPVPKLAADRNVRYFGGSPKHYSAAQARIHRLLEDIQPDVVFGEPTQFYELITIEESRQKGIPYFYPSPTRYPKNRITFYAYDTLDSFGGCGTPLPAEQAEEMRQIIAGLRERPSYMVRAQVPHTRRAWRRLKDKALILAGWLSGDHYSTPSPLAKLRRERAARKALRRWQSFARPQLPKEANENKLVLYAMQMQPESSLEVWGFSWLDQVRIIREAADALHEIGAKVIVKLNPSPKYEVSQALCDLCETHPSIIPLALECPMQAVFFHADAVLSVVGTVLIEAIMAGKPVGVLGDHAYARLPGVTALKLPAEIAGLIKNVENNNANKASPDQARRLLERWYAESYSGVIFDPLNQPEWSTDGNFHNLTVAFRDILSRLGSQDEHSSTSEMIVSS